MALASLGSALVLVTVGTLLFREAPGNITVRTATGASTYAVTGSEIVDDGALPIVDQAPGRTITLFACHPVGSAAQRYVVRGTLVS